LFNFVLPPGGVNLAKCTLRALPEGHTKKQVESFTMPSEKKGKILVVVDINRLNRLISTEFPPCSYVVSVGFHKKDV